LVSGDANGFYDVFLRDRWKGTTKLVSVGLGGAIGNDISFNPSRLFSGSGVLSGRHDGRAEKALGW
jgi:hypothetical protein